MWRSALGLCLLLTFIHGGDCAESDPKYMLLVPTVLKAKNDQKFCLQLSNLNESITVSVTLETESQNITLLEKQVTQPEEDRCVTFTTPATNQTHLGHIILEAEGNTLHFRKKRSVLIRPLESIVFIQSDKPIYKPGQTVQFRIAALDETFHTVSEKFPVVYVEDPQANRIVQWLDVETKKGIAQESFLLTSEPRLGTYKLVAQRQRGSQIEQQFTVEEYGLSLQSNEKVLAEVGKEVLLPCGKETNQEIEWLKNKIWVIKYTKKIRRTFSNSFAKDQHRFNVPLHKTNDLFIKNVQMSDSGTYTCQHEKSDIRTVELFVFEVSVLPSTSLLQSEDLVLALTTSLLSLAPESVSWEQNGTLKLHGFILEENNVQLTSSGRYVCSIKMDDGKRLDIGRDIRVFGFYDFPPIVYKSGKFPVILPWIFNFKIRDKPSEVHVKNGSISHSSEVFNKLSIIDGAASWPANSKSKEATVELSDLSVHLVDPIDGKYQMEILLKIGSRMKELRRVVYVASLTVPDSKIDLGTKVPLRCSVSHIDINWKLCWHQRKTSEEKCGKEGQSSLNMEVTVRNETVVIWTCSVTSGKEILVSDNVTLVLKSDVLELSNPLFWVAIGVGIFILLLIVVFITLAIAWKRRARRARHRAWLLENLHQHRRCECKGFSPQRLKENI